MTKYEGCGHIRFYYDGEYLCPLCRVLKAAEINSISNSVCLEPEKLSGFGSIGQGPVRVGWECPRCHAVYSPAMTRCTNCPSQTIKLGSDQTETGLRDKIKIVNDHDCTEEAKKIEERIENQFYEATKKSGC